MKALCDLQIGDELRDGALSVDELAARLDAHAPTLLRLLRVAEALGLLTWKRGRYRLTRRGRGLRTDTEFTIVPWLSYKTEPEIGASWSSLACVVWEWFAQSPEIGAGFDRTMRAFADFNGPELAGLRSWPKNAVVCDVAGGVGTLLSHVLNTDPSLRGILFDQPHLKDVLHDWADDNSRRILCNVAGSMRPGDTAIMAELIQDPARAHPLTPMVDLTMLVETDGGRQRSLDEFDRLFADAGLRRTAFHEGLVHSLVEAQWA